MNTRFVLRLFPCTLLAAMVAGCASAPPPTEVVQGPVGWGDPVNGLQVGIAAEVTQNAPATPQSGSGDFHGVRIFLKNYGGSPLSIIDPAVIPANQPVHPALWTVFTEPDHTSQVDFARPEPARVLTLNPGETTWFSVPLPMMPKGEGAHHLVAEYDNADSVINIVPAQGGQKTATGVWTGSARSPELFINETP